MKILILSSALFSFNCLALDDADLSLGLGYGSMYTGLGANLSFITRNDIKYVSAGCVESNAFENTCGFGLGWIRTDLFGDHTKKHGVGIYASIVGHERYTTLENDQYKSSENDIYGIGLSYTYFMNGIDRSGATFGLSFHATDAEDEDNLGSYMQIGYQF